MKTELKVALFGALSLGFCAVAQAATFTVNSAQDLPDFDTADNTCNASPDGIGPVTCTLRAAIQQANATAGADVIDFDLEDPVSLTQSLPTITQAVDIVGGGASVDCASTMAAANAGLVYTNALTGATVAVSDLTLSNCSTAGGAGGGAIRFTGPSSSTLNLSNVTITGSSATDGPGGAISLTAGNTINLDGGSLSNNTASTQGGAIFSSGTLTITNSSFTGNVANGDNGGGAIASNLATTGGLDISGSTFSDNLAGTAADGMNDEARVGDGGAIAIDEQLVALNSSVRDSTLSGNRAENGGGISVNTGTAIVERVTLTGNDASSAGGGVYLGSSGSVQLRNTTLSANMAANGGGLGAASGNTAQSSLVNTTLAMNTGHGIDLGANPEVNISADAGSQFIKNLLAANTPANCATAFDHPSDEINGGSNVSTDGSCGLSQTTDIENAAANIDELGNYGGDTQTHRLLVGSDAIDVGALIGEATDQRGAPTADGDEEAPAIRDAGAYEFAGFSAVEFTLPTFTEAENNSPAMVLARRYGDLSAATTATIESNGDGSATEGTDFDAVNEMVSWAAADGSEQAVEVTINDDNAVEGDETVVLDITSVPTGVDLGMIDQTTLTITDVEEGEFALQSTELTVTEGTDATVSIVITRNGGADGPSEVRLFTTDGGTDDDAATAGEDYDMTDVAVPFADGQTTETVEIAITDDAIYEQDPESFTVTIELTDNSGNARLDTDNDEANVSIVSDDVAETGTFNLNRATQTATEASGTVTFDVERTDGNNCQVDVSYTVNSGTADVGDFTPGETGNDADDAGDGTLTFADGDSANKTITINLNDDAENESTEAFTVVITDAQPVDCQPGATATVGETDTGTVSLTSDELEQFRFTSATFTGSESAGTAVVTIEPVDEISGTDVTIEYMTANGTAMAPDDYVAAMDQLTWQDGESDARQVTITVNEDSEAEGDEDFTVTISAITTETTEVVDPSTVTVTIQDLPGVRIVADDYVSDGESGSIVVTVERFGSFPDGGAQVEIATMESDPQSAEADVDFVSVVRTISWANEDAPLQMTASFPIRTDNLVEGDETFEVMLQGAIGLEIREPSTETLTITDDDFGFVFSEASYDTSETDGSLTITVERVGVSAGAGSVDYATADGMGDDAAVAGEDYTAATGTLNWDDGDAEAKTFTITIANDDAVENTENLAVSLSNGQPTSNVDPNQTPSMATISVADNDASVAFTAATFNADEDAGNAVITLSRSGDLSADASAEVTLTAGTATADEDYIDETLTALWAAGEADATVEVRVNADAEHEDDETLTLTLGNPGTTGPGSVVLGDPSSSELTIVNDDPEQFGSLQFSAVDYTELESNGTITITVTRENGDDGAVSVEYATEDGSATADEDYTAASGTLNWADGDAEDKTFTITIADDATLEGDETVALSLANPQDGATLGDPSAATATIANDDFALEFVMSPVIASETDGQGTLTVTRLGYQDDTVTVDFATSDGTAEAGQDYTAATGTLTFAAGDASDQTITVTIADDDMAESNESFAVSLSNVAPSASFDSAASTLDGQINITDNEAVLRLDAATYSVSEDGGSVTVLVVRDGSTDGGVSVTLSTADGTAAAGEDYTPTTVVVSFDDGEGGSMPVQVPIVDDDEAEDDETFTVALSAPGQTGPGTATIGSPDTGTVTITNDDASVQGALQFTAATFSAAEADGVIVVTVERVIGDDDPVSVEYATSDGSAVAGEDYTSTSGTLNWANDDAEPKTFMVTVNDDAVFEDDEAFTLTLSNATGGATIGDPGTASGAIVNDDTALRLSSDMYTAAEGELRVTITVERVGDASGSVSVNYATTDGTATAPEHYTQTMGTLNWADGNDTPQTFDVPLVDNAETNDDRTFAVTLSGPTPDTRVTVVDPAQATVTITDDEDRLNFSAEAVSVSEGAGSVTVRVVRGGSGNGAVSVDVTTADESAMAGADYTATTQTLSWDDGELGTMEVTIPISDDNRAEGAETFMASLSNATGNIVIAEPDTVTVTINDNDQAGVVITETGSGTQITEGGDGDTVLLSLATQPTGSVTVTIDPPDRVNVNPTTLVFTAQNWNQPRTVALSINDDEQAQANRTVSGSLSASSATDANYDGLSETVTIVINDAGGVQVISGDSGSLGLPLLALLGVAAAWQRRRRLVLR